MIEKVGLRLVGPGMLLILWWLLTNQKFISPTYLPRLSQVLNSLLSFLKNGGLLDVFATIIRSFASFAIASIVAIPLGLFLGINKTIYSTIEIFIDFFRSFPTTALIPLFLFFFGIGNNVKIALASFTSFWVILVHTIYGVWYSSPTRLKVAQVFRASQGQILKYILFFDALPEIFVGLRIGLSLSLVVIIVVEMMVGSKYGIGKEIYNSFLAYRISDLYSTIIISGLTGYFLNKLFLNFEKKAIHWVNR